MDAQTSSPSASRRSCARDAGQPRHRHPDAGRELRAAGMHVFFQSENG
jgi:hypothetical protein